MRTRTLTLTLGILTVAALAVPTAAKAPAGRFATTADTAADAATKLVWQRSTWPALHDWKGAWAACDVSDLAGKTDWRLPTARELESILDLGETSPAVDTAVFVNCKPAKYWTASDVVGTKQYFVVDFSNGMVLTHLGTEIAAYVRCVRGP
ncbi:MAG: DUF1566 domain-containing protein [Deltaproteobacteria bacterium]|nr:DUF1566 domain-containing protein [Deltaproteobacteria bacterium]